MSPALVHPFMRSVMEAPFPAPGRTITVRSFLPGAGDEVTQLRLSCLLSLGSLGHTGSLQTAQWCLEMISLEAGREAVPETCLRWK